MSLNQFSQTFFRLCRFKQQNRVWNFNAKVNIVKSISIVICSCKIQSALLTSSFMPLIVFNALIIVAPSLLTALHINEIYFYVSIVNATICVTVSLQTSSGIRQNYFLNFFKLKFIIETLQWKTLWITSNIQAPNLLSNQLIKIDSSALHFQLSMFKMWVWISNSSNFQWRSFGLVVSYTYKKKT